MLKSHNDQFIHDNDSSTSFAYCGLTIDYSHGFAESNWQKETFIKRKGFVTPPISEEKLFKCVVDMSINHPVVRDSSGETFDVTVYVNGVEAKKDYYQFCP